MAELANLIYVMSNDFNFDPFGCRSEDQWEIKSNVMTLIKEFSNFINFLTYYV